ncbi:MAG TPA: glycoside hydrolase family 75 protein, partial [Chthoniobacterales bacterium]|nr:glycoside hydrolase family 75 protein [Chthoniobacterales bacterium]
SLESTNDALTAASLPASYELHFTLNVAIPTPATTFTTLSAATPDIEKALPDLKSMLFEKEQPLKASPHYTTLYQNKIKTLNNHLSHLDQLLSRQLLYDCQTILPLTNSKNGFKALLVQAMMNVNTDGSDGDRNIPLEKLSPSYQPQTNYRWPKKSSHPNPNSRDLEVQLALKEIALKEPLVTSEQKNKLQQQINTSKTMIAELQRWSFLIGSADPFIVLPKFMLGEKNGDAALGDYAVVLYQGTLYPAVVGDIGPSTKLGEASLRLCRALDPRSGALHRPMEAPHVSYFIFPGSAEHPLAAPDYKHWSERCHQLWGNLGGSPSIPWHEWENLEQPWLEEK